MQGNAIKNRKGGKKIHSQKVKKWSTKLKYLTFKEYKNERFGRK